MTEEQLMVLQKQLAINLGHKVDVYHSEKHRGVLVVPHGKALHPLNVIYQLSY